MGDTAIQRPSSTSRRPSQQQQNTNPHTDNCTAERRTTRRRSEPVGRAAGTGTSTSGSGNNATNNHSAPQTTATGTEGQLLRGKRRSQAADKALRERYYAVLQRRDGGSSLAERIKTLRRMVLSQGLPGEPTVKIGVVSGTAAKGKESAGGASDTFDPTVDPEGPRCSLRGLVWKVLLGTFHTDAVLYIRLVGRGPSSEDVKIREDTFRTFHGDEEFRRRVPEDKLSRINNAFVRLNSPPPASEEAAAAAAAAGYTAPREARQGSGDVKNGNSDGEGWDEPESAAKSVAASGSSRGAGVPGRGKVKYVQGMTVLCAPLLFVMPEVDAFYCFNTLLNQHMPRYVSANLDGVHAGCALVDRTLSEVDPVLFNYLESKFLAAKIYAFPLVMSLHACIPPLEEVVKLWDAIFSFGVHLEVLICVAQCVSLREILLQAPNPYQHLNARNLPPLDAELLVSTAFSLIPHLPPDLMDEIAQHPFAEEGEFLAGESVDRYPTSVTGGDVLP